MDNDLINPKVTVIIINVITFITAAIITIITVLNK